MKKTLLFLVSALSAGCGGSGVAGLLTVEGEVTYDGKPVANAAILFIPEKGQSAYGVTDSRGHYMLTTRAPGDGALPGGYRVTVSAVVQEGGHAVDERGLEDTSRPERPVTIRRLVPEVYSDPNRSGLTAVVAPENRKHDFALAPRS